MSSELGAGNAEHIRNTGVISAARCSLFLVCLLGERSVRIGLHTVKFTVVCLVKQSILSYKEDIVADDYDTIVDTKAYSGVKLE